ncbi:probable E3 ubiquitin-protein ligase makorin-1 [Artemia franciscana]|uniref:probable E3 ubiquitin-protein ligase makorin-1 n=1 Tax=Artemia franciscana TaxID=6661 RepID=UPI0032DB7F1F
MGTCRYGDHCKFLHVEGYTADTEPSQIVPATMICKYFKLGTCYYGETCRFVHTNDPETAVFSPDEFDESFPVLGNNEKVEDQTLSNLNESLDKNLVFEDLTLSNTRLESKGPTTSTSQTEAEGSTRWVFAPEFVPANLASQNFQPAYSSQEGPKTYARILSDNAAVSSEPLRNEFEFPDEENLCPFMLMGSCRYENDCVYIHGEICDLCGIPCILPGNEQHKNKHIEECIKEHEKDMEVSFAVAQSRDKVCGVCMETVWEKVPASKQRFGLLPNCTHIFCLDCIRSWRQTKNFENKIIRSCPECRVQSDFVCPSRYWVESREEKEKLIEDYKQALSSKACRYYKEGRGECPFGNKCFYLHALPDGKKIDVGPPRQIRRENADGEAEIVEYLFWDFLEERDNHFLLLELFEGQILDSSDDDSVDWDDWASSF